VNAVLLQQAPSAGIPDPFSSVQQAWVSARWQLPGSPARSCEVLATVGARAGSAAPIWVNASARSLIRHQITATSRATSVSLSC